MALDALYKDHIVELTKNTHRVLDMMGYESLVVSSGFPVRYFQDDMDADFRVNPQFAHWCPISGPHHFVVINKNQTKPKLYYFYPDDYWHEHVKLSDESWVDSFDVETVATKAEIWGKLGALKNTAFIGTEENEARDAGFEVNPDKLISPLDWYRMAKHPYEVACTEKAIEIAADGHKLAEELFRQGKTERDIYWAFRQRTECMPENLGYNPIIGMDEKGAVLHYMRWRLEKSSNESLLIDAGYRYRQYNSDITRTHASDKAHPVFKALLEKLDVAQLELCDLCHEGTTYLEIHEQSLRKVGQILVDTNILTCSSSEEAFDQGLTEVFLPHGIGHQLGILVHDVGAKQSDEMGGKKLNSERFPSLRFTGPLRKGNIVTVEPGIYFNTILLDRAREKVKGINWQLVDELVPLGGIRIEDNIFVTDKGPENLSRKQLP